MNAGKHERALSALERYLTKYPAGSFRPEATALKIESLAKLGRSTESRAMADRFVAEHQGSPLAKRVKGVTQSSSR
jgi:outer membrane protein assembly factor BamD (BamD/ComL family)